MILAKPYLTLDGCCMRCAFERQYSNSHTYWPIRFLDGVADTKEFVADLMLAKRYTWKVEKVSRKLKKA